jgi:rhomboid protease GluP
MKKTSLLCPGCRKLISADEPACPYCGLSKPGSLFKSRVLKLFSNGSFDIVKAIITINVGFYILSILLNTDSLGVSANPLTFLSPSNKSLFMLGATGTIPIAEYGRWWTLVSASFLHAGIFHIFFNMAALGQLAPFVLQEFGFSRFVILYTVTGVAGFFMSYLAGVPITIGASASISGLIGAILYYGKSRGGFYGDAIYKQAAGWIFGMVLFGLLVPGINNWAHGGGVLSGILLAFLAGYNDSKKETFPHRVAAVFCLCLTILACLWAVLTAVYEQLL